MSTDRAAETRDGVVRHGMVPGSHERMNGPECRCGGWAWDAWNDRCYSDYTPADDPILDMGSRRDQ